MTGASRRAGRGRVAVVGCGFFAINHLHAWAGIEEAELVGVCDLDAARAEAAGRLAGVAVFTDPAAMIAAVRPDLVDIVTTPPSHLPLARLCADAGVAAIIQKPLAPSLTEACAIVDLAAASGVPMAVHENFRFQKPMRAVAELVRDGRIGTPHYCAVAFRCGYDIFAGQPYLRDEERFVIADNGVHVLDLARFLMGEIESVSCRVQQVRPDVRGEDMASALVGFAGGAMGLVETSYSSFVPDDPFPETRVSVEGSAGAVVLDRGYRLALRSGDRESVSDVEPPVAPWGTRPWHAVQDSVVTTCRHLLAAVMDGFAAETAVADNIRTLAAVEACYRSAAAGGALVHVADVLADARRAPC